MTPRRDIAGEAVSGVIRLQSALDCNCKVRIVQRYIRDTTSGLIEPRVHPTRPKLQPSISVKIMVAATTKNAISGYGISPQYNINALSIQHIAGSEVFMVPTATGNTISG